MAKPKNMRIYNTDPMVLATLREEYILLGFDTSIERGCLTVYTRKRKKPSKKKQDKKNKPERNKRAESAGRKQ